MKPIKKIICPVDVYDFQPEAAEYALTLANALEAKILVVYVLEPVPPRYIEGYAFRIEAEEKKMLQNAETKMAEVMSHFCSICQDKGEVVVGYAADKILEIAKDRDGDIIVMASHCRSLVCRAVHGSVTNQVLANSNIPVLVVYPEEK
ncbi:conserved hypothetical protein [uncultured delta proteobacterium]|uniref:Universal stress protein n=1 Tax=uncultured delta proteobacterium TaxID=34034 RepID=A0A212JU61_9DELT|nr:conserved hypothetical protein [uncultured delta proteobacterium]